VQCAVQSAYCDCRSWIGDVCFLRGTERSVRRAAPLAVRVSSDHLAAWSDLQPRPTIPGTTQRHHKDIHTKPTPGERTVPWSTGGKPQHLSRSAQAVDAVLSTKPTRFPVSNGEEVVNLLATSHCNGILEPVCCSLYRGTQWSQQCLDTHCWLSKPCSGV